MLAATKKRFRCEALSWGRVALDAKNLAGMIRQSGYAPDIVVAIGRGGLVPARILCDYLHIKDLTTIKVEHWGIAATPDKRAVIRFPLCADIKDRRVLLVDDTTDTGDTLRVALEYLRGFDPGEIRSAVLIHKAVSSTVPDYFVKRLLKWRWVIFPWHFWEDVSGFVRELREEGAGSVEDIRRELKTRYCLDVRAETIDEILIEIV